MKQRNEEMRGKLHKEETLKYLNNKDNINNNNIKVYKLCTNCNRKYAFDMQTCPKCHEYLFPVPETH